MSKHMRFGFFIPVYNAAAQIEKCVRGVAKEASGLNGGSVIHIVDDSSTDGTPKIAARLAKTEKRQSGIQVLYHRYENGPSRRENLALAMSRSGEDFQIFIDVDMATDIGHLKRLCALLERGNDVVIGSRYLKESRLSRSPARLAISQIYNFSIRTLFGTGISDHQCGFKGFRKEAFRKIYIVVGYDSSFRRGWFIDAEMLIVAKRLGLKIREIGISWTEGKKSTFRINREIKMLPYVLFGFPRKLRRMGKPGEMA